MGKISDAGGLGGLSIVESDGDGLETPAADRALRGEIGFHSSMRSSHRKYSQLYHLILPPSRRRLISKNHE